MLTFVRDEPNGDWVALYKDGQLVEQGHSFQEERLLELAGVEFEVVSDGDACETGCHFPPTLDEVVRVGR